MSDKCNGNLDTTTYAGTLIWLKTGQPSNCAKYTGHVAELKTAADRLNGYITDVIELYPAGTLRPLSDILTTEPSMNPTEQILTDGGNEGRAKQEIFAVKEALYEDLQEGNLEGVSPEAKTAITNAIAAWRDVDASWNLLHQLDGQYAAELAKDDENAKSMTQKFFEGLETQHDDPDRMRIPGISWLADQLANKASEEADAEWDRNNQASGSIQSQGIGALVANENYLGTPFREQCFIQANIFPLVEMRRSGNFVKKKQYPRKTAQGCLMAGGAPFGFLNRLTQGPHTSAMFSIPHEVLSQLQPQVLFYKVSTGDDGSLIETPVTFPKSTFATDIADMLKNKNRRGYGVGLKSFKWTYDGSDPFSTKKSIKAQLQVHATSFAELLRPRGPDSRPFRYADLAMKTGKIDDKVPPACSTSVNDTILDASEKLDFRLKAVVGYAIPGNLSVTRGDKDKISRAIADSFVTLELTPTIHSFDFDDTGRVTFTINYLAYIEDFFDDYYYDIFASGGTNSIDAYKFRMQKAFDIATDKAKGESATATINTDDSKALKALQTRNLSSLTTRLVKRKRMYYYKVPLKSLNDAAIGAILPIYDSNDQILNENEVKTEIANLKTEAAKSSKNVAKQNRLLNQASALTKHLEESHLEGEEAQRHASDTKRQVTFFFLYDLVDTILEGIYVALNTAYPKALTAMPAVKEAEKVKAKEIKTLRSMQENLAHLRVLLGPMEIANPHKKNEYVNISLGEIPISLKYYSEWMTDKILSRDRTGYTLSAFLNDFIKNYLRNFLNDNACGGDKFRQKASLHTATVSAYSVNESYDNITLFQKGLNRGKKPNEQTDVFVTPGASTTFPRPFLNTMGSRVTAGPRSMGQAMQHNYMMFYAGRTRPDELMTGNWQLDQAQGIYHYVMGDARGIVKNIRLDKKSAKGLKELRFEQEGYDGLLQLREVYNVTIDAFLLPNTYPGVYIFVDPRGFAPDTTGYKGIDPVTKKPFPVDMYELTRYGVGGYYMITKSEHTIAAGERSSQILASWVASKEKPGENPATGTDVESAEEGVQKCRSQKKKAAMPFGATTPPPPVPPDDVEVDPDAWNKDLGENENSPDDGGWNEDYGETTVFEDGSSITESYETSDPSDTAQGSVGGG